MTRSTGTRRLTRALIVVMLCVAAALLYALRLEVAEIIEVVTYRAEHGQAVEGAGMRARVLEVDAGKILTSSLDSTTTPAIWITVRVEQQQSRGHATGLSATLVDGAGVEYPFGDSSLAEQGLPEVLGATYRVTHAFEVAPAHLAGSALRLSQPGTSGRALELDLGLDERDEQRLRRRTGKVSLGETTAAAQSLVPGAES